MKDKKFLAKLIAVILVVSMLCVGMFACKKDEKHYKFCNIVYNPDKRKLQ